MGTLNNQEQELQTKTKELRENITEASNALNLDDANDKVKNLEKGANTFRRANAPKNKFQFGKKISVVFSEIAAGFKKHFNTFKTWFKKQFNAFKSWFSNLGKKSEQQSVVSDQASKETTVPYANSELKQRVKAASAKNQQNTQEKKEQKNIAQSEEKMGVAEGVDDNNRDEKLGHVNDKSDDLKVSASGFSAAAGRLQQQQKDQASGTSFTNDFRNVVSSVRGLFRKSSELKLKNANQDNPENKTDKPEGTNTASF